MSPSSKFFVEIMERLGVTTNRALAKILELPENHVSRYIKGKRVPGYLTCIKIKDRFIAKWVLQ